MEEQIKRGPKPKHPEMIALDTILKALEPLNSGAKGRVLDYVSFVVQDDLESTVAFNPKAPILTTTEG